MDTTTPERGSVWVLGDAATVTGFRLAGLDGRVVVSGAEARGALDALRAEGAALVLVTEALCDALGGPEALAIGAALPAVAVIPSALQPRAAAQTGARILRAVHRALGIAAEGRG
jgi:vacuolar-type H+-ATPase subunit F/Vma7